MPLLQIKEIDAQHADILGRLAALRSEKGLRGDWYSRFEMLLELSEQCRRHFAVEESMMRVHRFMQTDLHAGEHREFLLLLDALLAQAAHTLPSQTAVEFMERWWDDHIRRFDQAYVDWFSAMPPVPGREAASGGPAPGHPG